MAVRFFWTAIFTYIIYDILFFQTFSTLYNAFYYIRIL